MIRLTGIPASEGIGLGKVLIYDTEKVDIESYKVSNLPAEAEMLKLEEGIVKTKAQIITIREKVAKEMGESKAEIFDAHLELLEDDDLLDEIKEKITTDDYTAAYAVNE
ncbi:phosphoenolpyruvate-protein phosphotransferase [Oceanivirga miroungae]|uniref:Phosphoenolpyruvate-protein phosphotransferase n=1 Tax=Oceanivirga miroungae TaxID=1130046 RepID=A0A6I8M7R1_9FUSO|nr:phosphoenolpyruvate-protein phosphotransferase [Oceanivirga miroungae]